MTNLWETHAGLFDDAEQKPKRRKKQKRKHTVLKYAETLANRDGWVCFYCGIKLVPKYASCVPPYYTEILNWNEFTDQVERLHILNKEYRHYAVDHVHPYSKGGTDDLSNLVLTCRTCNSQKCDKSVDEFLEWRKAKGLS